MINQDEIWNSFSKEERKYIQVDYYNTLYNVKHDGFPVDVHKVKWMDKIFGKHNLMKKKLVVFTGSGISAESGIPTFRVSSDGLWENYNVEDVCMAGCLEKNPEKVHEFYNMLRKKYGEAEPNAAHRALAELQNDYDVYIITQNVDNLHEKAGSANVLHLHGEMMKCQAEDESNLVMNIPPDENGEYNTYPDKEINGHLVRPYVVMFGEAVPNMDKATEIAREADIFVIIGTSMQVYPAASIVQDVTFGKPIYYIDPWASVHPFFPEIKLIREPATKGVETLKKLLNEEVLV